MVERRDRVWLSVMLVLLVCLAVGEPRTVRSAVGAATVGAGDWPMYQGNTSRSGANLAETVVTRASAAYLTLAAQFTTRGPVFSSPVLVSGVLYVGSWDGYEYAFDVATHAQLWKQFLGTTTQAQVQACYGNRVGISSTPAVQGGLLYVGGGDGNLYALNVANGSVVWKTLLGSPPYYNWSSPLLYNSRVYIGVAAYCDPPGVQGKVLALNQSDGSLAASVALVPAGQVGATVWSSPALDSATGRIYVTTGNNAQASMANEPNSEAFLALDPNTLAVLDRWQIPLTDQPAHGDADFGATPTLFDVNGVGYIGALNKNGIYYALNRSNLAAGPVWKQLLGGSPLTQDSRVSPSCYAGGTIYAGSGPINGTSYGGTVRAFDAATGHQLWAVNTIGKMFGAVTCLPGLVVDNEGTLVEVRDASTGQLLFSYAAAKGIQGSSVISNGVLYAPSRDGSVYAFTPRNTAISQLVFQDNFDAYLHGALPTGAGTSQWTSVNVSGTGFGVSVTGNHANSSPNSLRITLGSSLSGSAAATKTYPPGTGYATHACRFSLYLDPTLQFSGQNIALFTAQNQSNPADGSMSVQLTPSNALEIVRGDSLGRTHMLPLSATLTKGQWYTLEVDQTNNPATGSWSLWLNGTQVGGESGVDTGNVPVTAFLAGDSLTSSATTLSGSFYEDDVVTAAGPHIG